MFKAIQLSKPEDQFCAELVDLETAALEAATPSADVRVGVVSRNVTLEPGDVLTLTSGLKKLSKDKAAAATDEAPQGLPEAAKPSNAPPSSGE